MAKKEEIKVEKLRRSELTALFEEITKLAEKDKQYNTILKRIQPLIAIDQKSHKTIQDIINAQQVTCWKSLSYCCGSPKAPNGGKECVFRDATLASIGLTLEDYEEYKNRCNALLLKFMKNKKKIHSNQLK